MNGTVTEMEMEMDFPAAEELEYLESNSVFPDDGEENFFEKEEGDAAAAFDDLYFDECAAGGQLPLEGEVTTL